MELEDAILSECAAVETVKNLQDQINTRDINIMILKKKIMDSMPEILKHQELYRDHEKLSEEVHMLRADSITLQKEHQKTLIEHWKLDKEYQGVSEKYTQLTNEHQSVLAEFTNQKFLLKQLESQSSNLETKLEGSLIDKQLLNSNLKEEISKNQTLQKLLNRHTLLSGKKMSELYDFIISIGESAISGVRLSKLEKKALKRHTIHAKLLKMKATSLKEESVFDELDVDESQGTFSCASSIDTGLGSSTYTSDDEKFLSTATTPSRDSCSSPLECSFILNVPSLPPSSASHLPLNYTNASTSPMRVNRHSVALSPVNFEKNVRHIAIATSPAKECLKVNDSNVEMTGVDDSTIRDILDKSRPKFKIISPIPFNEKLDTDSSVHCLKNLTATLENKSPLKNFKSDEKQFQHLLSYLSDMTKELVKKECQKILKSSVYSTETSTNTEIMDPVGVSANKKQIIILNNSTNESNQVTLPKQSGLFIINTAPGTTYHLSTPSTESDYSPPRSSEPDENHQLSTSLSKKMNTKVITKNNKLKLNSPVKITIPTETGRTSSLNTSELKINSIENSKSLPVPKVFILEGDIEKDTIGSPDSINKINSSQTSKKFMEPTIKTHKCASSSKTNVDHSIQISDVKPAKKNKSSKYSKAHPDSLDDCKLKINEMRHLFDSDNDDSTKEQEDSHKTVSLSINSDWENTSESQSCDGDKYKQAENRKSQLIKCDNKRKRKKTESLLPLPVLKTQKETHNNFTSPQCDPMHMHKTSKSLNANKKTDNITGYPTTKKIISLCSNKSKEPKIEITDKLLSTDYNHKETFRRITRQTSLSLNLSPSKLSPSLSVKVRSASNCDSDSSETPASKRFKTDTSEKKIVMNPEVSIPKLQITSNTMKLENENNIKKAKLLLESLDELKEPLQERIFKRKKITERSKRPSASKKPSVPIISPQEADIEDIASTETISNILPSKIITDEVHKESYQVYHSTNSDTNEVPLKKNNKCPNQVFKQMMKNRIDEKYNSPPSYQKPMSLCDRFEEYISSQFSSENLDDFIESISQEKEKHIACAVVEFLANDNRSKDTCPLNTWPKSPMSIPQQSLLCFTKRLNSSPPSHFKTDFYELVMKGIEYRLFLLNSTPSLNALKSLSTFYTALCKITKQKDRLKLFCMDALYCLSFKAGPLVYNVLETWPCLLPQANSLAAKDPLTKVIVHYLLSNFSTKFQYQSENLKYHLQNKYGYLPGEITDDEILKLLIEHVKENTASPYSENIQAAFMLLGKKIGVELCHKKVILGSLLPIICDHQLSSLVRATAAHLIGALVRPFPPTMGLQCNVISKIFQNMLNDGDDPVVEDAIISSLTYFCKKNLSNIVGTVLQWQPKAEISEHTLAQFRSVLLQLPPVAWKSLLTKNFNKWRFE